MNVERSASRTAAMVAAYRGRASARPEKLCDDRWANALAGDEGQRIAAQLDAHYPHMELWIAVRTAYLDEQVRFWTGASEPRPDTRCEQVVLLGAGFDTRAARLATPGVRFFEVDHPASQTEKRRRLSLVDGYPVENATYVACDFERDDFVERLRAAGFRADVPTLLLWEGVTPYLNEEAVRHTLRRIAEGCHPHSILLFDHLLRAQPKKSDYEDPRLFVEKLGEPMRWGTTDALPILFEAGFRHVRSLSFDEACLTHTGTYLREREFRFQKIVLASCTAPRWPR